MQCLKRCCRNESFGGYALSRYSSAQRRTAVTAHLKGKQLLLFPFVRQCSFLGDYSRPVGLHRGICYLSAGISILDLTVVLDPECGKRTAVQRPTLVQHCINFIQMFCVSCGTPTGLNRLKFPQRHTMPIIL